jgi:hypothetical protein
MSGSIKIDYRTKFSVPYEIVKICESYFSALRAGYPLWEV